MSKYLIYCVLSETYRDNFLESYFSALFIERLGDFFPLRAHANTLTSEIHSKLFEVVTSPQCNQCYLDYLVIYFKMYLQKKRIILITISHLVHS